MNLPSHIHLRPILMHAAFAGIGLLCVGLSHVGLQSWVLMSHTSEQSSNLWLIPLISLFLLFRRRHVIFVHARFTPWAITWVLVGILIQTLSLEELGWLGPTDATILAIVGFWVTMTGAFIYCYGAEAWNRARFPIAFMLFAIPFPEAMQDQVVRWLQHGSATIVHALFGLLRVPFSRDGLTFYLPELTVEIAPECSGIRSSYALLVLSVLLAYLLLQNKWTRSLLVAAVVPLALLKNAVRIVTLCLLTMHVDSSILDSPLHHQGGFVFFGFALAIEGMLCYILRRYEPTQDSTAK